MCCAHAAFCTHGRHGQVIKTVCYLSWMPPQNPPHVTPERRCQWARVGLQDSLLSLLLSEHEVAALPLLRDSEREKGATQRAFASLSSFLFFCILSSVIPSFPLAKAFSFMCFIAFLKGEKMREPHSGGWHSGSSQSSNSLRFPSFPHSLLTLGSRWSADLPLAAPSTSSLRLPPLGMIFIPVPDCHLTFQIPVHAPAFLSPICKSSFEGACIFIYFHWRSCCK